MSESQNLVDNPIKCDCFRCIEKYEEVWMKKTLMDDHADTVNAEEELEPDFTWKLYLTHINTNEILFQGSIEIKKFRVLLDMLEKEDCDLIYCKHPIVFT